MGGYSYQALEARLERVERLVEFIASSTRMKAVFQNGIVRPDGTPVREVFEGSMLDLFKLQQVNDAVVVPSVAAEAQDEEETY